MLRQLIVLAAIAAAIVAYTRSQSRRNGTTPDDEAARTDWENEGGHPQETAS